VTLKALRSATSLLASEVGLSHSDAPDGQTQSLFGPEVVLANPFPLPESKKALKTNATYGPTSCALSPSDALQISLESRLRLLLHGSDLCEVIWKPWATPWGQCLSKPRARVRITSETASGLWATLRATDGEKGGPNMKFGAGGQPLPAMAAQSLWQTMVADDALDREKGKVNSRGEPKLSAQAIQASAWPTPTTRDHKDGQPCENVKVNGLLGRMVWPKPTSLAHAKDGNNEAGNSAGLVAIRNHAIGQSAQTEKPGALNPEFVCWLMGFPAEWVSCGVSAMRSIPAPPRLSSKRRVKP
jgi:hypothetical protein